MTDAVLSADGQYRYLLTRRWGDGPLLPWIMLNPSTADSTVNDPTIRRCMGFARAWGYPGIAVGNMYGLRSTTPAALRTHPDPVGPDNVEHLRQLVAGRAMIVAAWGAHPGATQRARDLILSGVLSADMWCLGRTAEGHPRHPLYVRADARLIPALIPYWAQRPSERSKS